MNVMIKNYSINKLPTIFLLLLFCLSAKAQNGEIKCTFNLNDQMLDVKIEVPENRLGETKFALEDLGGQFDHAAWSLDVSALAPGSYDLVVYAWSNRTHGWAAETTITVASGPANCTSRASIKS